MNNIKKYESYSDITDNLINYDKFFKSSENISEKKNKYYEISKKINKILKDDYNLYKRIIIEYIINKILNKNKINGEELKLITQIIEKISEINLKDLNIYSTIKLIIDNIKLYKLNDKQKKIIINLIKGTDNNLIYDYLNKYGEEKIYIELESQNLKRKLLNTGRPKQTENNEIGTENNKKSQTQGEFENKDRIQGQNLKRKLLNTDIPKQTENQEKNNLISKIINFFKKKHTGTENNKKSQIQKIFKELKNYGIDILKNILKSIQKKHKIHPISENEKISNISREKPNPKTTDNVLLNEKKILIRKIASKIKNSKGTIADKIRKIKNYPIKKLRELYKTIISIHKPSSSNIKYNNIYSKKNKNTTLQNQNNPIRSKPESKTTDNQSYNIKENQNNKNNTNNIYYF